MEALRSALYDLVDEGRPMTVRQIFYRAVAAGLIDKTENDYDRIGEITVGMRKRGDMPFEWIVDGTRWVRQPAMWDSPDQTLRDIAALYRRNCWRDQPIRVEVWCEKDAMSGVLYPITEEYGVPFYVVRGFGSLTYKNDAAKAILRSRKPTQILYLGDHDPSGQDIQRDLQKQLGELLDLRSRDWSLRLERIAVTPQQIKDYNLLTRLPKKSDSRAKKFQGEAVDVDALHPDILRRLLREAIEERIDHRAWDNLQAVEESEREALTMFANRWRDSREPDV